MLLVSGGLLTRARPSALAVVATLGTARSRLLLGVVALAGRTALAIVTALGTASLLRRSRHGSLGQTRE